MIGNIIILAIAIGITGYVLEVARSELIKRPIHLYSAILLTAILFFSIIKPNIPFIKSPYTPEIHAKLIDSETNRPISGATVIIDWGYSRGEFPDHSSVVSIKQSGYLLRSSRA